MKLSAILAPLLSAKASHDTIMEVVLAFESEQADALQKRRESDAKRQAEKRKRDAESRDITLRHSDRLLATRVEDSSSKEDISGKERKKDSGTPQAAITPRNELETVLDAERAKAVIDHRQRIGKPLTAHAAKLLAHSLAKWHDANEAADAMVENGWQGFKTEWLENRQTAQPRAGPPPKPTPTDALKEFAKLKGWTDGPDCSNGHNHDVELFPADGGGRPGEIVSLRGGAAGRYR